MTQRSNTPALVDDFKAHWPMSLGLIGLGGVVLAAEAAEDQLVSGIIWSAILAAVGLVVAFGGRFSIVRQARGSTEDERDATLNSRAMATAGTVLIFVLTGCLVYSLVREQGLTPYVQLTAVGGASYAIALLFLRWRS